MNAFRSLALVLALAPLAGCGRSGADVAPRNQGDNLQEVANMLRDFQSVANRGPNNLSELAQFQNDYAFGHAQVKAGDLVVVWGARMGGEGGGGSAGVIAYEKKTPTSGGWVLLANGTVKELSAADFGTTAKASK